MFKQLGRQGLGPTDRQGRHQVEVGIQLFQAAVDPHQQGHGGLLTDALDPGDVVGGVAHQRQQVDDLMICSGATPNLAFTPSTSMDVSDMVLTRVICPSTN